MFQKVRISQIILLALTTLLCGCMSIFYYPRVPKAKFYDPAKVDLVQEEVEIYRDDGLGVHGWWFNSKTQPAKGTIIFFHGNAENLTSHFMNLAWMPAEGYNYLIWDYPGYGVSEGIPSAESNIISAHLVMEWVHKNKDPNPLIIYGQSLGGNIAFRATLDLKDHIPIKAFIADSTFLSYRSLARKKASEHWLTWLFQPLAWLVMSDKYAPDDISNLSPIPILVIQGQKDQVMPPQCGDEIFAKAKEPKEFWKIEDGMHTDVFWGHNRTYRKKFLDYLAALPKNPTP